MKPPRYLVGLIAAGLAVGLMAACSGSPTSLGPSSPVAHVSKVTHKVKHHKGKPKAKPAKVVTFTVSGTGGADITYGSDSINDQGGALPFTATLPIDGSSQYYAVTAQLQGSGSITCSVSVDGVTKKGAANGGYNICQAEVVSTFLGGWAPA